MTGKAITSLVCGILSILLFWTGFIGAISGIVAIVFFAKDRKNNKSGMATTGLVTAIIGLCLSAFFVLLYSAGILAILFG